MFDSELAEISAMDLPMEMAEDDERWSRVDEIVVRLMKQLKDQGSPSPSMKLTSDLMTIALEDLARIDAVRLAVNHLLGRSLAAMTLISEFRRVSDLARSGVEQTRPPVLEIPGCDSALYDMNTGEIVGILRAELVRRVILDNRKGG